MHKYLIRDDGVIYAYNETLAKNPRLRPHIVEAPKPAPVVEEPVKKATKKAKEED